MLAWVAFLLIAIGLSTSFGGDFKADYSAPGSDSSEAQELLESRFPSQSGDTVDIVVRAEDGVNEPAAQADIQALLADLADEPHVASIEDPFTTPGAISPDGRTLVAHARLDVVNPVDVPVEDSEKMIAIAEDADRPGLDVALGGQTITQGEAAEIGSEAIGFAAAALILLLMFGSVVAAGLPLLVAIAGLAVSGTLTGVLIALIDAPDWSTSLATMMGIGIGIDYALLMVTRFREWRAAGLDPRMATVATLDTAGRAVMVAGSTVVISMLGLFAMGLSFMRGAALVTILAVLVVMLASVTLFPALLGYLGKHVDRLRLPLGRRRPTEVAVGGHVNPSRGWLAWSRLIDRYRWVAAVVGVAALLALASPYLDVRYGFPDAGNNVEQTETRRAYDLLAEGFGPGMNGPLVVVAELPDDGAAAAEPLVAALRSTEGVVAVTEPTLNEAGDTAVITVIPAEGPQAQATEDLVHRLARHQPSGRRRRHRRRRARRWCHGRLDRQHREHRQAHPAADRRRRAALDDPAGRVVPLDRGRDQGRHHEPAVRGGGVRRGGSGARGRLGRAAGRHRHPDPAPGVRAGADVRGAVRTVDGLRGLPGQPDARGLAAHP